MQITDEDVVRTLREVVAERPDYVYERPAHMEPIIGDDGDVAADCLYVHTSPDDADDADDADDLTPGCLVGAVFHRLGVPLEDLATWEGRGGFDVAGEYGVSYDLANALSDAQASQDGGKPWGVALAIATEKFPEVLA